MTIMKGVNDEEGEPYKRLILGLHNHLFKFHTIHWWYSLHMAVQWVPAHSDLPQVDVASTWMIDMTTLERGVENSTLNTITSHLQTPFSMKENG